MIFADLAVHLGDNPAMRGLVVITLLLACAPRSAPQPLDARAASGPTDAAPPATTRAPLPPPPPPSPSIVPAPAPASPNVPAPLPPAPAQEGDGAQATPCPEGGHCAAGLKCVEYYGIAGARGPKFTSCEIPCPRPKDRCPAGQACTTIADGPGRVCRPN